MPDRHYLSDEVVGKVRDVAEGAASMTGARLEIEEFYPFYENVLPNVALANAVGANIQAQGINWMNQCPADLEAGRPPTSGTSATLCLHSNSGTRSAKSRWPLIRET